MNRVFRWLVRFFGFGLVLCAGYPLFLSIKGIDRRDYVSAILSCLVGWLIAQAGIELIRPESAE